MKGSCGKVNGRQGKEYTMAKSLSRENKMTQQRLKDDHARQLEQAQRLAKADTERFQLRWDADVADFRATISRLEVDLLKVGQSLFRCTPARGNVF